MLLNKLRRDLNAVLGKEQGFTLVEILIALGLLGIIGLIASQITLDSSKVLKSAKTVEDVSQVHVEIHSMLANPAHCNANFYNRPTGTQTITSPGGFRRCQSGNCRTTGTAVVHYPVVTTSWQQNVTKISDTIRLRALSYQVSNSAVGTRLLTLQLSVTLERKEKNLSSGKSKVEVFSVPVIVNGSTIVGCPTKWMSTVL